MWNICVIQSNCALWYSFVLFIFVFFFHIVEQLVRNSILDILLITCIEILIFIDLNDFAWLLCSCFCYFFFFSSSHATDTPHTLPAVCYFVGWFLWLRMHSEWLYARAQNISIRCDAMWFSKCSNAEWYRVYGTKYVYVCVCWD